MNFQLLFYRKNSRSVHEITANLQRNFNWHPKQPHVMPKTNTNVHEFAPETVYSMLQGLKMSKAAGSDGLTPKLIFVFKESLAEPLCAILNESIRTSVFPSIWKKADIVPISKTSKPKLFTNYVRLQCLLSWERF